MLPGSRIDLQAPNPKTNQQMVCDEFSDDALESLLATLHDMYGFDFRDYSRAHIRRRVLHRMSVSGLSDPAALEKQISTDPAFAYQFLQDLSITVTEMFRDPGFYRRLREKVIPVLRTYPFIKIWHAGCSTGQEAYSMAILLQEEGVYERTTIYATDFNQEALDKAKAGIFPNRLMKEYTSGYQLSGGKESFGSYYTSSYDMAIMNQNLKKNIVWGHHNLVTDSVFAEVHLVLCRNVLIYFNKELQEKVHGLFYDSLISGGVLCLGSKESLQFSKFAGQYAEIDHDHRIFKKKY